MKFFNILVLTLISLNNSYATHFECEMGSCQNPCNYGCSEIEQCNDHYFQSLSNFCAREQLKACYKCLLKTSTNPASQQDYIVEIAKIFEISDKFDELPDNIFENTTNAMVITLHDVGLFRISANTFNNLLRLQKIDLSDNKLAVLPDGLFNGLYDLEELNLRKNQLTSVNEYDFSDLTTLGKLDLSENNISFLHENALQNLTNLRLLMIMHNEMVEIFPLTFQNNLRMRKVDFFRNKIIHVHQKNFENLRKLEILRLSFNNITSIADDSFKDLQSLEFFHLENNQIKIITQSTFTGLEKLNHIYLNNNKIQKISSIAFSKMNSIEYLNLKDNICINRAPWGHAGSTGTYVDQSENELITAEALERFFSNSECSKCILPEIQNGQIVSAFVGDVYKAGSLFKQFQTAGIKCDDGYSFLEEPGEDGLFTCNGDYFNKQFSECISEYLSTKLFSIALTIKFYRTLS